MSYKNHLSINHDLASKGVQIMIVIFLLHRSDIALTGSDIHSFGMSDIFAYANASGPAVGIL